MDYNETYKLLIRFGYDSHTVALLTAQAHHHNLTHADIAAWIVEAQTSRTINNPLGFVRARIQGGDKPPSSSASRSTHADRQRYVSQFFCPDCQTSPCICDWNSKAESLHDYRQRIIQEERSKS